jgi:hypothetical protein
MSTSACIQNTPWCERQGISERNLCSGTVLYCEETWVIQNNDYEDFNPWDDYSSTVTKGEAGSSNF